MLNTMFTKIGSVRFSVLLFSPLYSIEFAASLISFSTVCLLWFLVGTRPIGLQTTRQMIATASQLNTFIWKIVAPNKRATRKNKSSRHKRCERTATVRSKSSECVVLQSVAAHSRCAHGQSKDRTAKLSFSFGSTWMYILYVCRAADCRLLIADCYRSKLAFFFSSFFFFPFF